MEKDKMSYMLMAGILLMVCIMPGLSCIMSSPKPPVSDQSPIIVASPDSLTFVIDPGKGNYADQSISIINAGGGVFTWSMSDNSRWIYLQQPEGAATVGNNIKVRVDVAGMSPGNYTGIVTITAEGATNSLVHVPVYLNVLSSADQQPPVTQKPADIVKQAPQPGSTVVVWKNQTDFMAYATTNACIVNGSITNSDKFWYMRDVKIVTKSGASTNIVSVIPPGETVMYNKFIPCFQRQEVNLQYSWQTQ